MDKRSVLALVICLFIFVGWMFISSKIWPQAPPPPPPKKPDVILTPKVVPALPQAEPAIYPEKPPITLQSKYLDFVFTNKGAGIQKATLYYPKDRALAPADSNAGRIDLLPATDSKIPHFALRQVGGPDEIESQPWQIVEQAADRVEFLYRLRNGVEVTKLFTLDPARHLLQLQVRLDNKNKPPEGKTEPADVPMTLEMVAVNGLHPDSDYRYDQYLLGIFRYDGSFQMRPLLELQAGEGKLAEALKLPDGPDKTKEINEIEEKYFKVTRGKKEWFGLKNRFFTTLVDPDAAALDILDYYQFRVSPPDVTKAMGGKANITATARTQEFKVGPSRRVVQFNVYVGPLVKETLRELAPSAEDPAAYNSGCWFAFIVRPAAAVILELLRFTAGIVRNMGVAIILTTLLIRLCLFPLSLKSQRNALAMQALAPKIQALKERYKDDNQKYSMEQMRLFKENKVNPVAGCLPLLIQMPVFIGMYSVFEMAIELRRAPFMLWMKDLSEPDRLLGGNWGFTIPMPIIPNIVIDGLNILPILMMITWFLQAYMTPRSPDPQIAQQQKMMMYMPIVIGLTCYGLASGLSLYFLTNSLLSMAELKIIKRFILKVDASGKPLNPPDAGPVKK